MATTIGSDYIQYPDNSIQKQKKHIVKTRYTSSPTVNVVIGNADTDIPGTTIDMGVPEKGNNWYRCEYQTVHDDWAPGSGYNGFGMSIWRNTPSAGWQEVQAQGQHATYDNNLGDFYQSPVGLWYIPVHPTYPTEPHSFKLSGNRHPGQSPNPIRIRVNCTIGQDNRVGDWQNNMFSVTEIDGDSLIKNATTPLTVF